MFIEFFVEEYSAKVALQHLIPAILGDDVGFDIHAYQGKQALLRKLPDRLLGYASWMPDDCRIVVLIDEDREDCHALKRQLEEMAAQAGLLTKSMAQDQETFQVLNRIAVEELEAWFFGDITALREAYPRLSAYLHQNPRYRNPDAITGGTWETLERILQQRGYHRRGLPKVKVADEVARHMVPERNTSRSFQVFRMGLLAMRP